MGNRPALRKATLLLHWRPDLPVERGRAALASHLSSAPLPQNVDHWRAVLLDSTDMPVVPHQVLMKDSPAPFDAVFHLVSADRASTALMSDALVRVVEALDSVIDRSRSVVLVSDQVAITPGDGPIQIAMLLRRPRGMDHAEFMEHWYGRHADIGEAVEGVRYRQNHVDFAATAALTPRTGIEFEEVDGLTESYYLTTDEAYGIMTHPDVAVGAIADEKRFIDHARSQFGFYRRL
jgi:hypothetical protein